MGDNAREHEQDVNAWDPEEEEEEEEEDDGDSDDDTQI